MQAKLGIVWMLHGKPPDKWYETNTAVISIETVPGFVLLLAVSRFQITALSFSAQTLQITSCMPSNEIFNCCDSANVSGRKQRTTLYAAT
jgi:hypothetical protein